MGKKNLLFVIVDDNDEIFGYFNENTITNNNTWKGASAGLKTFHFNYQSYGRLHKPMKFLPEEYTRRCGCELNDNDKEILISIGEIFIYSKPYKHQSWCFDGDMKFSYPNVEHPICGSNLFQPLRIVIIQMN